MLKQKAKKSNALVLTFDDGPGNKLTPRILDLLDEYNVKATFFLLGKNIPGREQIVRQIAAGGHEICSHGYDHLHHWKSSPFAAIKDIKKGWQVIDNALGTNRGKYPFRPPCGKLNLFSMLYLCCRKIPICYWSLDIGDTWIDYKTDNRDIGALIKKSGGAILLAHDFDRCDDSFDEIVHNKISSALATSKTEGMPVITFSKLVNIN